MSALDDRDYSGVAYAMWEKYRGQVWLAANRVPITLIADTRGPIQAHRYGTQLRFLRLIDFQCTGGNTNEVVQRLKQMELADLGWKNIGNLIDPLTVLCEPA